MKVLPQGNTLNAKCTQKLVKSLLIMLEKHADKNILLCLLISCSGEPMGAHDCHQFQIYPLDLDEIIDDSRDVPSVSTALVKLGARP